MVKYDAIKGERVMPDNVDDQLLVTMFLGYKYRKEHNILYQADGNIPLQLIEIYYSKNRKRSDLDVLRRSFINKYIKSESEFEGVHNKDEILGLAEMYEYAHSIPSSEFNVFNVASLHKMLYSKCPHPEVGGRLRTRGAILSGGGYNADTSDYQDIYFDLLKLEDVTAELLQAAREIRYSGDYSEIVPFVTSCVKLKSKLIMIHPFDDGNGRTIRCFINRILEEAGIPPIYVKKNEREEYLLAMNKANNDQDYSDLTTFYLYKICDSIIELDINDKVKEERKSNTFTKSKNLK